MREMASTQDTAKNTSKDKPRKQRKQVPQEKCKIENQRECWEQSHAKKHAKVKPGQSSSLKKSRGTAMIGGRSESKLPPSPNPR